MCRSGAFGPERLPESGDVSDLLRDSGLTSRLRMYGSSKDLQRSVGFRSVRRPSA